MLSSTDQIWRSTFQHDVLNYKDGVSSRPSSRFDKAKVEPLHQPARKDNCIKSSKSHIFMPSCPLRLQIVTDSIKHHS